MKAMEKKPSVSHRVSRHGLPCVARSAATHVQHKRIGQILRNNTIQAKLSIGQPNDKYEQEADRVADQVMSMPEPKVLRQAEPEEEEEERVQTKPFAEGISPLVQRQEEPEEEEEEAEPEREEETVQTKFMADKPTLVTAGLQSRIQSLKGGGQALLRSERTFFEPRFGYNFSNVRVHSDSAATASAKALNARAFTLGNHVVMQSGEYHPGSRSGQRLLAHELTHVIQQTNRDGSTGEALQPARAVSHDAEQSTLRLAREDEAPYLRRKHGAKRRRVITFIMGPDTDGFYDSAKKYWSSRKRADRVIATARSFAGIIAYLSKAANKPKNNKPWGEINIVVHGSALGADMQIRRGSKESTTIRTLQNAINKSAIKKSAIKALPNTIVDNRTSINLHGCEIGQSKQLLQLISLAFGGNDPKAPKVYAPKVAIAYREIRKGSYREELMPKFWVVLPKQDTTAALGKLRKKYSWLPSRQKARIKGRHIVWDRVAYNDKSASPLNITTFTGIISGSKPTIPPVNVQFYEVKLPPKNYLKGHARIIKHFDRPTLMGKGRKFTAYLPGASGKLNKSFDVYITTKKLLGDKVWHEIKYIFFEWQVQGGKRVKIRRGQMIQGVAGDRSIAGGWKARLRKWVGPQAFKQYAWKLKSQKKLTQWYGARHNVTAEGTGYRATIKGLVVKRPSRRSRYFGGYKPKGP